jgi:signal transduction histidine kinase
LGLSIVNQIVKAMGGGITVSSEWGQGAAFIVTLSLKLVKEKTT